MTEHGHKQRAMLRDAAEAASAGAGPALRMRVNILGAVALVAYLALAVLSYPQAAALWHDADAPNTKAFFQALATQLQPVFTGAQAWLVENRLFGGAPMVVLVMWIGLGVVSLATLALVASLLRQGERADAGLPRLLLNWSYAFAAACTLALPVFTQDFWLSAAWGRMAAAGVNPYYNLFTAETLAGLPLDHFPMPMSYGPLWGLVSAAVMLLAGGSVLAAAVLFKAVLAAAWVATLYLLFRITEGAGVRERCLSVAVLGWAPAGVGQSLAEGHNDIAMVVPAMLWLFLLLRGRSLAPAALVASCLCKYATAPLFAIDMIHAIRVQRIGWRRYLLRLVVPALLGLAALAVFFRSPQFFDGVRLISGWHFLQPRDAVHAVELMLGVSFYPMALAAAAAFPVLAAQAAWAAWREPSIDALLRSAIAVMAAVLFTAVSHFWPWYAVWALALAALLPTWWLSRFIFGVSILAPFTLAAWWVEPFEHHREVAALLMYLGAIGWTLLTRPRVAAAAAAPARVADPGSIARA